MFRPNNRCDLVLSSNRTDRYGQPLPGERIKNEPCAVVRLQVKEIKSQVRADSTASRGAAHEFDSTNSLILVGRNTRANINDLIEIAGFTLVIKSKQPRWNMRGVIDHYELTCQLWNKTVTA